MTEPKATALLCRTCLVGCLLGVTATFYLLAGIAGGIQSPVVNGVTVAVLLLAGLFFLAVFFLQMAEKNWLGLLLWGAILVVLLAEVCLGLVPPAVRDELIHHLAMPRLYLQEGKVFEVPFAPFSYYPMLLEMLYIPSLRWGWDSLSKLVHGLYGFLTGVLIFAYCTRRMSSLYGLFAFLFFVSIPIVARLGNLAYVDLGLTFYSTASVLCLLLWLQSQDSWKWLVLAGLMAGLAGA